ncbi:MAG: ATP-binding protein [Elusimicrobiota bacterium]|jgi:predicted AAA+ superfamily ATPase|nr:ATP-binding protein [Elusimicrobiota bacterium]
MYQRTLSDIISKSLYKGKVIVIYGARQVGKTTLSKQILTQQSNIGKKIQYFNCELLSVKSKLETTNEQILKDFFGNNDLIVLDEAQTIPQIGQILKIMVDTYPEIQIIATGSSSFDLSNQIGEPLVGRSKEFKVFSLSAQELQSRYSKIEVDSKIDNLLRFGSYPGIIDLPENESMIDLESIASNYLYKDILAFDNIRNSSVISKLLKLLSLQLGGEASAHELGRQLSLSSQTVKKYIDLLEKSFIIFSLQAYSGNLRKEISKSHKIYFYDLGIRNAIINNFNTLDNRTDVGALWENFCIIERMKSNQQNQKIVNNYFWRAYQGEEIDYIEEYGGKLYAYELKYNSGKMKSPKNFLQAYKDTPIELINKQNWNTFF